MLLPSTEAGYPGLDMRGTWRFESQDLNVFESSDA